MKDDGLLIFICSLTLVMVKYVVYIMLQLRIRNKHMMNILYIILNIFYHVNKDKNI